MRWKIARIARRASAASPCAGLTGGTFQYGLMIVEFHRVGEDRRRRRGFADDNLVFLDDLVVMKNPDFIIGDVHIDAVLAKIARHPTPDFHIGDDVVSDTSGFGSSPERLACVRGVRMPGWAKPVGALKVRDRGGNLRIVDQIVVALRHIEARNGRGSAARADRSCPA